jgi:hypothetical protein
MEDRRRLQNRTVTVTRPIIFSLLLNHNQEELSLKGTHQLLLYADGK